MLPNDNVGTDVMDNRAIIFDDAFEDLAKQGNRPAMTWETTLLTTSIVITVLLNGKMIAHKIPTPVSLQCDQLTSQPADQSQPKTASTQWDKHSKWSTLWPTVNQPMAKH